MISIIIITLILIIWEAPFEHKNRPISENERYKYKKYSFIITSIYAVFILLSSEFYHVLLYVLIVIDLSSIPCIIESNGKVLKMFSKLVLVASTGAVSCASRVGILSSKDQKL